MSNALAARHARDQQLQERFDAQIAFAERLLTFHPEQESVWKAALFAARRAWEDASDTTNGLAAAEAALAPIAVVAKTHTIHCAGHAHIDMNWMWGWPETVAVTLDTFRTVLRLMDEFPDFHFGQSQASVYRIVEEHDPELLARIQARVKEGRWEVLAAHWVEGDRNLAGGEALCRHLLETRSYIQQLFGLTPEQVPVDWTPDTFGHANTMPGIDTRGAAKYLYCCRTGDINRPPVFWWESPDGSRQLVHREIAWYINAPGPEHAVKHLLDFRAATGLTDWLLVYGVGDHGGGPTRRDLRRIIDMQSWPCFPQFRFSRVDSFFALLEKEGSRWPVLAHELNFEFTGCYTSQSAIKRANRIGETLCGAADAASALAACLVGRPVRHQRLSEAWRTVLFNHFHDILPGSGVPETRQFCQGQLQQIQAIAGQERQQALRAIAERIDTTWAGPVPMDPSNPGLTARSVGAGVGKLSDGLSQATICGDGPRPLVIFNPTAWERTEVVTLTVWDGDATSTTRLADRAFTVSQSDGSRVAPQACSTGHYWGHEFVELRVPVTVPALGWQTVAVTEESTSRSTAKAELVISEDGGHGHRSPIPTGAVLMRNEVLEIMVDREHGGLSRIVERATSRDLIPVNSGFGRPEIQIERPIGMSAWQMGDPLGGPQTPILYEMQYIDRGGPWLTGLIQRYRHGESTISVTYRLAAGSRKVEMEWQVRWLERGNAQVGVPRLQVRFPAGSPATSARYETPFGFVSRPSTGGREVPALRWAAVQSVNGSIVVLNDGKHGHNLDGSGTLRLSLIRSSYEPDPLPELGDHSIKLAVTLPGTVATVADCTRWAAEHDQPLAPVSTTIHGGPLPASIALLSSQDPQVVIHQIKAAADDQGLIVRLANVDTTPTETRLTRNILLGRQPGIERCDVLERPDATNGEPETGPIAGPIQAPVTLRIR